MKNILRAAIIFLCFVHSKNGITQCPTCTPDLSCISTDGYPTICPFEAPVATVGEYYEHVLTFYIPAQVVDPESGVTATLIDVTFTSVAGIPYGLAFTLNDADGVYHPSEGENHGCATICGFPLLPGTYTVNITVDILATAFGFEVTQVQNFPYTIVVVPGEGGTDSFVFNNPAACGNLDVTFEATLQAPLPSVTTYNWDFGNGETGTDTIENVLYDQAGEYEVILTTTISNYALSAVSVSNLSTNGNGDVDEVFSPPADPYFIITDGSNNAIYTSSTVSNSNSTTWSEINIQLQNPPYTVQFFDEDDLSSDDDLGTTTIDITEGTNYFDIGNGTQGTFSVALNPTNIINDTTTVNVFPIPDPNFVVGGTTLYYDNPNLVGFVWSINGIATNNFTNMITLTEGGEYTCQVINEFGCIASSEAYLFCPAIDVQFDLVAQEVYVENIYESYQWYFNGVAIVGATQSYLSNVENGNYAVELITNYGCTTLSEVYTVNVGIEEEILNSLKAYPNPVRDILYLNHDGSVNNSSVIIYDLMGNIVMKSSVDALPHKVDFRTFASGVYFLELNNHRTRIIKQ